MFHDIGQLVMDLCLPQQFSEILQHQAHSGADLRELEFNELGFDHAEIGADLVRLWNFPPEIEQVVRYWHRPELQTAYEPLVCLVHTAALLDSGVSGDTLIDRQALTPCGRMKMSWERIESCLPRTEQLEAVAQLISG
jgi:HD-like signal output (HDOD) protein